MHWVGISRLTQLTISEDSSSVGQMAVIIPGNATARKVPQIDLQDTGGSGISGRIRASKMGISNATDPELP